MEGDERTWQDCPRSAWHSESIDVGTATSKHGTDIWPMYRREKCSKRWFYFFGPKSLWMFLFKKDVIPKNHSSDPSATDIQQCSNYWSFRPLDQWPDYQTMCPGWNHQACGSTTVLITLQMKCARSTVSGNLFQCLAYLFVRANNLAGGFN
jgi:hypothetical protein